MGIEVSSDWSILSWPEAQLCKSVEFEFFSLLVLVLVLKMIPVSLCSVCYSAGRMSKYNPSSKERKETEREGGRKLGGGYKERENTKEIRGKTCNFQGNIMNSESQICIGLTFFCRAHHFIHMHTDSHILSPLSLHT